MAFLVCRAPAYCSSVARFRAANSSVAVFRGLRAHCRAARFLSARATRLAPSALPGPAENC
jgi:hypothetical protein